LNVFDFSFSITFELQMYSTLIVISRQFRSISIVHLQKAMCQTTDRAGFVYAA
jgi:hypothetical protein